MGDGAEMARHAEDDARRAFYAHHEDEAIRYVWHRYRHAPTPEEIEEIREAVRHADGDEVDILDAIVREQQRDQRWRHAAAEHGVALPSGAALCRPAPPPIDHDALRGGQFWMLVLLPAPEDFERDRAGRPRVPQGAAPRSIFFDQEAAERCANRMTQRFGRVCIVLEGQHPNAREDDGPIPWEVPRG